MWNSIQFLKVSVNAFQAVDPFCAPDGLIALKFFNRDDAIDTLTLTDLIMRQRPYSNTEKIICS